MILLLALWVLFIVLTIKYFRFMKALDVTVDNSTPEHIDQGENDRCWSAEHPLSTNSVGKDSKSSSVL